MLGNDDLGEASLRPTRLDDFIGQAQAKANLAVFVQAARARGEALDHVLLHGPPGLGKTTLAQIVARELGVGFRATSGPVIQRSGDLGVTERPGTYDFLQLCFTVQDMNVFLQHLAGRQVKPLHAPQHFEGTNFITLLDPDGRHVRVMTPWRE